MSIHLKLCLLALGAGISAGGWFWLKSALKKHRANPTKKSGRAVTWLTVLLLAGLWLFAMMLLQLLFVQPEKTQTGFWTSRVQLGGVSLSTTVILGWAVLAVLLLLAVLARLTVIPRMTEKPRGVQSLLETCVEAVCRFARRIGGWVMHKSPLKFLADPVKRKKAGKFCKRALVVAAIWLAVVELLRLVFGTKEPENFSFSIWASRVQVGGFSLSMTVVMTWMIMAVLILAAVLIRLLVIPKMTDKPHGLQNVLEICVEYIGKFTKSEVGDLSSVLPPYIFTLSVFMVSCAVVELFGVRAPTSDITLTFAMALITFVMTNYYGIKKKGFLGRIKSMAKPTPVVFPIKIVTDLAVPVSLSCRLFGNMLGGMIVIDLLYSAMKNAAVGFPSVLGLYFNVFHPLIQAYIFVTLTLTYINEAAE